MVHFSQPPGPGGVQCSPGQIFCCGSSNVGGGVNHFPGGGYAVCGDRNILDVPGWVPEYGQVGYSKVFLVENVS